MVRTSSEHYSKLKIMQIMWWTWPWVREKSAKKGGNITKVYVGTYYPNANLEDYNRKIWFTKSLYNYNKVDFWLMNNIIMSGSSFKLRELISSKKWSMSTKNASSILHIIATKHTTYSITHSQLDSSQKS